MRNIYLYIVAAVLMLGFFLPQKGEKRIFYIIAVCLIHIFVSGFRYCHLTGDLIKYQTTFHLMGKAAWSDPVLWHDGKNFGFHYFLKLVHLITGGDYQAVLLLIAISIHAVLGYMVYRYSPSPWFSFLIWNCLAFYIFGFSAIKQSLAMAFVMLSFDAIARRKLGYYLICTAAAASIHLPALVFFPAYFMCRIKVTSHTILLYLLAGILLYVFKDPFVRFLQSFYYEDSIVFTFSGSVGNRFIMILLLTMFGILFSGFDNPHLEKLFHIMAISTLLQMLSGFDNLFTRMTDYYFQLSVLFLPMVFTAYHAPSSNHMTALFQFNSKSRQVLTVFLCLFLIWFYYTYNINITLAHPVDDYLNYRFMWDVKR